MNHTRLDLALDEVAVFLEKEKIELKENFRERFAFGGIAYGTDKRESFEIETLKGKGTRKYFQLIITRLDSGFYEVVKYIL
jgi:hypothetical protein